MTNDWETIEVQSIIDENARLRTENEQLKSDLRYWQTLAQSLAKKNNRSGFE